jgi:hypothetical protein
LQKTFQRLADLGRLTLTVGFQGATAEIAYKGGMNVASVAFFQEFGTIKTGAAGPPIPARSFLRRTFFEERDAVLALYAHHISRVINGESSALQALRGVGKGTTELISNTLRTSKSWAKPNTISTLKKKHGSTPLINTATLLKSVSWAIRLTSSRGAILEQGE